MTLKGRYRDGLERSVSAPAGGPGGNTEIDPTRVGLRWCALVGLEGGDGAQRLSAMVWVLQLACRF